MRSAKTNIRHILCDSSADGLITYHRTDGLDISAERLDGLRAAAVAAFPDRDVVAPTPRTYKSKAKNAQEAHEAVVVTEGSGGPRLPAKRPRRQRMLYELIWRRSLACQMKDASFRHVRGRSCATGRAGCEKRHVSYKCCVLSCCWPAALLRANSS